MMQAEKGIGIVEIDHYQCNNDIIQNAVNCSVTDVKDVPGADIQQ